MSLSEYVNEQLQKTANKAVLKKLSLTHVSCNDEDPHTDLTIYFLLGESKESIYHKFVIPISDFPGCCGVDVIHEIHLNDYFGESNKSLTRRKGIASALFSMVLAAMEKRARQNDGAGMIAAATTSDQLAGTTMCLKFGFKRAHTYRNPNTGRTIHFWTRLLVPAKKDGLPKVKSAKICKYCSSSVACVKHNGVLKD